jgi:hypothetical protein
VERRRWQAFLRSTHKFKAAVKHAGAFIARRHLRESQSLPTGPRVEPLASDVYADNITVGCNYYSWLVVDPWFIASDSIVGRLRREMAACALTILAIERVKPLAEAQRTIAPQRGRIIDSIEILAGGCEVEEGCPDLWNFFQKFECLFNTWTIVSCFDSTWKRASGDEVVKHLHYSDAPFAALPS